MGAETTGLLTGESDLKKGQAGIAVFKSHIINHMIMSKGRRAVIILLSLIGLLTSVTTATMGAFGALPSLFPHATNQGINFTIMGAVHLLIFIITYSVLKSSTSGKISGLKHGEKVDYNKYNYKWDLISLINRRYIKIAFVIGVLALLAHFTAEITFLAARGRGYAHYFSESAFDSTGAISQITVDPASGNKCDIKIANTCNSGAAYTMDDITAQTWINSCHLRILSGIILAYSYLMLVVAIADLEVNIYKSQADAVPVLKVKDESIQPTPSESAVFLYIPQTPIAGASDDGHMRAIANLLKLIVFVSLVFVAFQIFTLTAVSDSKCSFLDTYGAFFLTEVITVAFLFMILGIFILGTMLKDNVGLDTTDLQRSRVYMLAIYLLFVTVAIAVFGGLFLVFTGESVAAIPSEVMCRAHSAFRVYNANKLLANVGFTMIIVLVIEYYFHHQNKIGSVSLLIHKVNKKNG